MKIKQSWLTTGLMLLLAVGSWQLLSAPAYGDVAWPAGHATQQ